MQTYFHLIRWKNLLFLALIQLLMQHTVVVPILQVYGFDAADMSHFFPLLILATLLIAAGGYVINDYFDVKIDRINKPEAVLIGEKISPKGAMTYYQILTFTGIIAGLIVAYSVRSFTLGFIFLVTPGLLWFYSASYKRQFLIGNLAVSLMAALAILVVAILAMALLSTAYNRQLLNQTPIPQQIYSWIGGFATFAFLLTMIREIIKDMEDLEGDKEIECRTMPVKWGINRSKIVVYTLIGVTLTLLLVAALVWIKFEGNLTIKYTVITVIIPLFVLVYLLIKAKDKKVFGQASALTKVIMLAGVLYAVVFYFLMAKTHGISFFGLYTAQ